MSWRAHRLRAVVISTRMMIRSLTPPLRPLSATVDHPMVSLVFPDFPWFSLARAGQTIPIEAVDYLFAAESRPSTGFWPGLSLVSLSRVSAGPSDPRVSSPFDHLGNCTVLTISRVKLAFVFGCKSSFAALHILPHHVELALR